MVKLNKIVAVILALGSSMAFADSAKQPNASGNITIPVQKNSWRAGIAALYMQPSFGGNGLGYSSYSNYGYDFSGNLVEVNGAPNRLSNVKPNREWAFQLDGSYGFGNGNDVDVNWYHLNNVTKGSLPQGTLFAGSAPALYAGFLNVSTNWDAINVELGQRIDFGAAKILRLHAGVEWAQIKTKFTNFPRQFPTGPAVFVTNDNISYTGFGPRAGGDFTYVAGKGFGVYAKAAAGLLVGTAKQSISGYSNLGGFNLYSTGNYNQTNNSVVVPELDAKLGLKYDYQTSHGVFGLDVGYLWATYLGALVSQVGSGVVSSAISNSSTTNFNLNGLACTLTFSGNV